MSKAMFLRSVPTSPVPTRLLPLALCAVLLAGCGEDPEAVKAAAAEQAAAPAGHSHGEEELVSRGVQSTFGLGTAVIVYGAAIGGLFALIFLNCFACIG